MPERRAKYLFPAPVKLLWFASALALLVPAISPASAQLARNSAPANLSDDNFYLPKTKYGQANLYSEKEILSFIEGKPFLRLSEADAEDKFRKLARQVGRLDLLFDGRLATCTAFLFYWNYLLTNAHCVINEKAQSSKKRRCASSMPSKAR